MSSNIKIDHDQTEISILFEYVIQRVPTQKSRVVATKQRTFAVKLIISRTSLDQRGYPDPRAMWFAERLFLENFHKVNSPNVRLLKWKSHLESDEFILSEYEVTLSPLVM